MSGDLSLSKALGGLRIANPDDTDTASSLEGVPTASSSLPEPASSAHNDIQTPRPTPGPLSAPKPVATPDEYDDGLNSVVSHSSAPSDDVSRLETYRQPTSIYQPEIDRLASHAIPSKARPQSGQYSSPSARIMPDDMRTTSQHEALKNERSRSSMYGTPTRSDSRSVPAQPGSIPTRELSRSSRQGVLPPTSGTLPPRRSSKGMGGGYASAPTTSTPPRREPYGPEESLPPSSEEWKDRGAAVGVRREVDPTGKTVLRHVKKGVRDFSFGRVLGEGSYSTVFLATDRQTLKEYAIKVLEKRHIIREKKIKYVNIEKDTLNRLTEHPGIVRLYYTFQDETSLYYVLDLCNGGELLGVLKKTGTFDLECTRFYGAQILDAINYMHSRGVIHRDLKPENVLLDDNMHVKITDFGTAKLLKSQREPHGSGPPGGGPLESGSGDQDGEGRAASFVGTAEYVSPELLTSKNACKASDLWAFGCIVYQLLAGRPPFKAGTEYLTFQKIVNLEYEFPPGFPAAARDLVERCLVLDPARRLTVEHIKNHEFFDGHPFGKALWRQQAPRLRAYNPPPQEPTLIQLNGYSNATPSSSGTVRASLPPTSAVSNGTARPTRIITELPPPTQLDIEWSPVLTRTNERIIKLGDLMVISSPLPASPHSKNGDHGEGHKKLSRFFGGSTTKKRQRLVMITSSGRIVFAPAGGDDKRAKQEISLLAPECSWRTQVDVKGQTVWCVNTDKLHYTFEDPKSASRTPSELGGLSADDWIEALVRAKDLAISQNTTGVYAGDSGFGDMSSAMSSPASTLGGRGPYEEGFGSGTAERPGRNHLSKSQASLEDPTPKRNRFSKRQSKSGLGAQF